MLTLQQKLKRSSKIFENTDISKLTTEELDEIISNCSFLIEQCGMVGTQEELEVANARTMFIVEQAW